jgi:hypothetical protein
LAAAERWTTQQTADAVAAWRQDAGVRSKGGRPSLPGALKVVRKIEKVSAGLVAEEVARLEAEERSEVRERLLALREHVDACLAAVEA